MKHSVNHEDNKDKKLPNSQVKANDCHQSHSFLAQICTKSFSGPIPHLGSSQRSPDPLAGKVGGEGERKGSEGRGRMGRQGKGGEVASSYI